MKHIFWLIIFCAGASIVQAQDGRALVTESLRRHAPPSFVTQELALVMSDREGRFSVRTFRHVGQQGQHALVVETPPDLRGATIRLDNDRADGDTLASPILGSDFLIGDFAREALDAHDYRRLADEIFGRQPHYVIDALPRHSHAVQRRLYLRQDNLFVTRIDYRDADGNLRRRQSFRDPRPDESGVWRPGMILIEDMRDGRRSLLKVERRVHVSDAPQGNLAAKTP